jgi:hypothetical protein
MCPRLSKELTRKVESDLEQYASKKHPHDPEIKFQEILGGFRLWTTEPRPSPASPRMQETIVFSTGPIFANVHCVHCVHVGSGREWTRQVLLNFDPNDNPYFTYENNRCDTVADLAQELLSPLIDVNFAPPER